MCISTSQSAHTTDGCVHDIASAATYIYIHINVYKSICIYTPHNTCNRWMCV